jgi:DNA end-binding protein Ku
MPRAIWTGAISFGLVNVPVRLYSAQSPKSVSFHMLHGKDGGRIQMKRFCSVEEQEVPYEEIVKGFEVQKGRYVELDPRELEALDPAATRAIDIEDFVDLAEIDPVFYEASYHLVPDRGAGKAYRLLLEVMKRSKKVGIGRFVMRTRQHLAAVRPVGDGLMLSTMLYADEVVPQSELESPGLGAEPKDRELQMAEQLVDSLSARFEPERYRDEYRERVLALVERKAEGQEIVVPPAPAQPARVVNLIDALAASLARARDRSPAGGHERLSKGERRAPAEGEGRPAARRTARRRKTP